MLSGIFKKEGGSARGEGSRSVELLRPIFLRTFLAILS